MFKREVWFACTVVLSLFLIGFGFVYAEEVVSEEQSAIGAPVEEDTLSESDLIEEKAAEEIASEAEDKGAVLEASAGLTPGSGLYFIEDKILSNFRSDLDNREKKVAEIKAMAEEGNIEAAREALERYNRYADSFEKEVSPGEQERARESARAIRQTVREIREKIPEEQREFFVDDVIEKETSIESASEIASRIGELCALLAKQDPDAYYRTCKTDKEGAPKWQMELDEKLTAEQREEAEKFGEIMSQCFETAGRDCNCEDIDLVDFSEMCSIAAPLATACDEGDEEACEDMDDLEMPELPEYLQDVMDKLEGRISESRLDLYMPSECKEAGATNPKDCMKIMIKTHAPPECREALTKANPQNEREARVICEEIMFKENAPEECVKAGLKDHKECGKLMFSQSAPEECIKAGMDGSNPNDARKCREIMESQRGEFEGGNRGPGGFGFGGADCRSIQDTQKRLACYDGATQGAQDFNERFMETKEQERQCAMSCQEKGGAWDFSGGQCRCNIDNFREEFRDKYEDHFKEDFNQQSGSGGFRGPPECQGLSPQDCEQRMREKFGQSPPQGFGQGAPPQGFEGEFRPPENFQGSQPGFPSPEGFNPDGQQGQFSSPESSFTSPESESSSEPSSSGSSFESESSSGSGSGGSEAPVTGGVITGWSVSSNTNRFLWYYFR